MPVAGMVIHGGNADMNQSMPMANPSPETWWSCGLFDFDVEAEGADSVGEALGRALRVSRPTVIGSEVLVGGSVLEHMVDDAQHRGATAMIAFLWPRRGL